LKEVSDFLDELEAPLRLAKPNKIKVALLNIPICQGDKV
jgi:hypothetical protein